MAFPVLDDRALELLLEVYKTAARELSKDLELLLFAKGEYRFIIYNQILRVLSDLKLVTKAWARESIESFFRETDELALGTLRRLPTRAELLLDFTQINESAVEALVRGMMGDIEPAFASVSTLAQKVLRGASLGPEVDMELRKLTAIGIAKAESKSGISESLKRALERRFSDGAVQVIGKNAKTYRYSLDYYASLVTHQTMRQAATLATVVRAGQNNFDLVRVSPNPSVGGDYCDAYRGHVFSISGMSERFPPLSDTPNGGPPFHPWCKHSISIFIPDFYGDAELDEYADVPEEFLMKAGDDDQNQLLKSWNAAVKNDPSLAELVNP